MKITNSIKKKFLLIFGGSLSLLFILLMVSSYYFANKKFYNVETKYLKYTADSLNKNIFYKLENTKENILTISNDDSLTIYNQTEKDATLDYFLLKFSNNTSVISLLNKNGNEISRYKNGKKVDVKNNIKSTLVYSKSFNNPNEVITSEIKYSDDLKSYGIEFVLRKTNYFNDEFVATIFGIIPVEKFLINVFPPDKELIIRLVDKNNIIVFSSKEEEINKEINLLKIKKDKLTESTILNEKTITYSRFIVDNTITLLVSKRLDSFLSELNSFIKIEFTIFLIIFFIVMIFIYYFIKNNISMPIESLTKSISLISKGDHSHKISINTNDEIEILGKSFNKMNQDLHHSLLKVKEKENELNKLNLEQEDKIKKQVLLIRDKNKLLIEQTKMASLGEMLNNIAHQWRQPLSVISTAASGLKVIKSIRPLEDIEIDNTLDGILINTVYLSETIDYFRSFIKGDYTFQVFNPDENINKSLVILESSLKLSNTIPILNLNANLSIANYPNDLTQIFMNIINNSIDAFNINKIKEKYILISSEINDNNLTIRIKDNGKGIPVDIIEKIFEPYFTTKHQSQGTGLGLYMSYKIITERMKGKIIVKNITFKHDNKEFTGAEFIITLPIK